MRYLSQFLILAIVCLITTGCATARFAQPPRDTITFDYVPRAEAVAGSADITFAIVGVEFVVPTSYQQGVPLQSGMLLPPAPAPPLFQQLISNMTKDFEEVLTARGFAVKGSYRTLSEMIYPDKEGSDLILTAKVKFASNTNVKYKSDRRKVLAGGCLSPLGLIAWIAAGATPKESDQQILFIGGIGLLTTALVTWISGGFVPSGQMTVACEINLEVYEGLTDEIMWSKRIPIPQLEVIPQARQKENPGEITYQKLMEIDNKFYSDLGHLFEAQYDKILNQIYTYLDPREMAIVKNQAMELRKRKVY